ncbi:MAG TPA: hypothetical protein VNP94_09495 [Actinomycetota bacterium]|nr:hypothetical protein [Actinomycetota bacterium]
MIVTVVVPSPCADPDGAEPSQPLAGTESGMNAPAMIAAVRRFRIDLAPPMRR